MKIKLLCCLVFSVVFFAGCKKAPDKETVNRQVLDFEKEGIINAVFSNYDAGRLNCVIRSKRIQSDVGGNLVDFTAPRINMTGKNDATFISAKSGKYDLANEIVFLEKDVYVHKKSEDTKLYSENLTWDRKGKKITVAGPVREINKGNTVTGENLSADDELNNIVIEKNVKVEINKI